MMGLNGIMTMNFVYAVEGMPCSYVCSSGDMGRAEMSDIARDIAQNVTYLTHWVSETERGQLFVMHDGLMQSTA